jgi:folate-binding Fe-S cluster repair protein YgfZ
MPIGTPFHERTLALCESLNYREWSGYYAVSAFEAHHEHEYNAIRNAAALIDISPLFKYRVTGPDASRLVDRIITRDVRKISVGQVVYTPWCDEHGKVIDDGTVSRLEENVYRWTAADPSLRWLTQNSVGLDVQLEDISESVAALALQGTDCRPTAKIDRRCRCRASQVLQSHQRINRRRARRDFADRIHGRSGIRNLGRGQLCFESLGHVDSAGKRLRHQTRRHAGA